MKVILYFLTVMTLATTAFAQEEAPATPAPAAPAVEKLNPLFLKVEKDGQTSYILPTSSDIQVDVQQAPENILEVYAQSNTVVVDLNVTQENLPHLQIVLGLKEENFLRPQLNDQEWEALLMEIMTPDLTVNAEILAAAPRFSYYLAAQLFKGYPVRQVQRPFEQVLAGQASADKNMMAYEDVMDYVAQIESVYTIDFVKSLITTSPREKAAWVENFQKLSEAYLSGDLEAASAALKGAYPEAEYNVLVKDRAAKWLSEFNAVFALEGQEFMILPLELVVGEDGIAAGLTAQGYTVTVVEAPQTAPVEIEVPTVETPVEEAQPEEAPAATTEQPEESAPEVQEEQAPVEVPSVNPEIFRA